MKTKLFVILVNHAEGGMRYLLTALKEYDSYQSVDMDVTVMSSSEHTYPVYNNLKLTEVIEDGSLGHYFPFEHKKYIIKNIDKYDYFMYYQNDHLVPEKAVQTYIEYDKQLKDTNMVIGFVQYEVYTDGVKYATAHQYAPRGIKKHDYKNLRMVCQNNDHQAGHIFRQSKMKEIIANPKYLDRTAIYADIMSGVATNVFRDFGIKKTTPVDHINDVLIHHLPNRYVTNPRFRVYTIDNYITDMNKLYK